jgi:hypothetical protein
MTFPSDPTMPRVQGFTAAAVTLTGLLWLLTACASMQAAAPKVAHRQVSSFCPRAAS